MVTSRVPARVATASSFAFVVASDAPASVREAAHETKVRLLGSRVQLCDGRHDEARINAALADFGSVVLSEGTFHVGEPAGQSGSQVHSLRSGMHVRGAGAGLTVVRFDKGRGAGADRYAFGTQASAAYGVSGWSIGDLSIELEDEQDHGIQVKGAQNGRLYNLHVRCLDQANSNDEGIQFSGDDGHSVRNVVLQNVLIEDTGAACLEIANDCHDIRMFGCVFRGSSTKGLFLRNGDASEATDPRRVFLFGCEFDSNTQAQIDVGRGLDVHLVGCNVHDGLAAGFSSDGAANAKRTRIIGGTFWNNGAEGIYLGGENELALGATVFGNGQDTGLANNRRIGIRVSGSGARIAECHVFDDQGTQTQRYALRTDAGASGTRVQGGLLEAGLVGTLNDDGTGTTLRDVQGYVTENWGSASVSPDGSGNGTIAHGLSATPAVVHAGIRGDTANHADVEAVDGTNITVRIKDSSGADVTSGSFTVDWEARL